MSRKASLLVCTLLAWAALCAAPFSSQAAGVKLSAIASGGAVVSGTDQLVGVRSGTTDLLLTVGSSCVENLTSIVVDNGAGGLTLGAGQVTNAMLVNNSMTIAGHSTALGGSVAISCSDLSDDGTACTAVAPANTTATASNFFTAYTAATGAFTKAQPAFSDISGQATNAQLATQTANTVLGALTATTPSGLALPSCTDTSGNHLNYTSGTGFSCGTSDLHVGTVTSVATTSPITGGTFTTTGTIACATCATTTNGGALSGTAPVAVSAAGAISITGAANQVLAGSGPAFTATPTIGTSVTTPLVIGGTTASSTLTIESTSGAGTTDSIVAKTGSQATSQTWNSNGTTTLSKAGIDAQSTPAISTATFTPDFSAGNHFIINLVHASCPCTLANPTNIVAGQSGVIAVVQSATGSDTVTSYGGDYIFTNTTAGTLSTAANAVDYYSYYVEDATHIRMNFIPASPQSVNTGGFISNQTKFTTSGCSVSSTTGGATAGKYTSGTTGTCTVTVTMNGATGLAAPNGWSCWANDETTTADKQQTTSSTTTTAVIAGTTVSGDIIDFGCIGF
jgi:hypothetical protein